MSQRGGKVPPFPPFWDPAHVPWKFPSFQQFPCVMASVKWHPQHGHYLPLPPPHDPGPMRLTNLEGERTTWGQWQKKEQPSKASASHLNNEGVRWGLLDDAIFSSKFPFCIWCNSIILTWVWEPSGDSDWAIMWPWSLSLSLHEAQCSYLWNGCDNSECPSHFIRLSWELNTQM